MVWWELVLVVAAVVVGGTLVAWVLRWGVRGTLVSHWLRRRRPPPIP